VKTGIIVTGIRQIDRKLHTLPLRLQKKVVRQSIRKGLKLINADVKATVPVLSGLTQANVKTRAVKKRKRGQIEIEVRVASAPGLIKISGKTGKKVFYPAIVEYKHNDFMKRSYVSKGEAARQVTLYALLVGVEQEAGKP
jgi:hypothetical protein